MDFIEINVFITIETKLEHIGKKDERGLIDHKSVKKQKFFKSFKQICCLSGDTRLSQAGISGFCPFWPPWSHLLLSVKPFAKAMASP
ncbi:hypothetical protein [Thermoactinomyces mirandus]|uniref:hypothetical protein n=1 Tax=Thermoactinomyces mirandus TaxID=2756294 RepID=UPI0015EF1540|nr:hypothetical protein [Thermoactinomyces mirandus]